MGKMSSGKFGKFSLTKAIRTGCYVHASINGTPTGIALLSIMSGVTVGMKFHFCRLLRHVHNNRAKESSQDYILPVGCGM